MPHFDTSFVEDAKFQVTKFRQGYDMIEVDDFLDRVVAAAQSGPHEIRRIIADIPTAKFQVTTFREGYDMVEVDDLLDIALHALRKHIGEGADHSANSTSSQVAQDHTTTPHNDATQGESTPRRVPRLMATDVIPPTFTTTLFAPGYAQQNVDVFFRDLQRIVAMGREEELLGLEDKIVNHTFPKSGVFTTGYSVKEVNIFLSGLLRVIRN